MRKSMMSALVAVVVVAGVLIGIVTFGSISYPSFPSLRTAPDDRLEGIVVFTRSNREQICVHRVDARGGPDRVLNCAQRWASWVTWTDDLVAVSQHGAARAELVLLDPHTGAVVRTEGADAARRMHPDRAERSDGARVATEVRDGTVRVLLMEPDGSTRTLTTVEGPRDYGIWELQWSPDERWILAVDTAQRALVIDSLDGETRLLAEDVSGPAWGPR